MFRKIDQKKVDKIFVFTFVILAIIQFLVIRDNPFDLSPDETHYWQWSKRLDLSYYSKGPLIAYLISLGTLIFGDIELGVRFPAFFLHQIFLLYFYLFARKLYSPGIALAVWLSARSLLMFSQMGVVMTTDAPAGLFWLFAIIAMYEIFIEKRRDSWIFFAIAVGIGFLAKYTVISLYLSIIIIFLFDSRQRKLFYCWQFVCSLFLLLLLVSPVLIWNYQHDWVNFSHNSGHLLRTGGFKIEPKYFVELVLGQMSLVSPIIFYFIIYSAFLAVKIWLFKVRDERLEIFLVTFLPLFCLILILSFTKNIYANWPLPLYITGLLLVAELSQKNCFERVKAEKLCVFALSLSFFITVIVHLPFYGYSLGLPPKILPTKKLVGWSDLGTKISEQLIKRNDLSRPFILTESYQVASEISFYEKQQTPVYCANIDNRRMNQYDIWGGFSELKGRDALLILNDTEAVRDLQQYFELIEPLAEYPIHKMIYEDVTMKRYYLFVGKNYSGASQKRADKF